MHADAPRGGSPSLQVPDYWWYRARGRLLRAVFEPFVDPLDQPARRVLDVGSADGPSSFWQGRRARVTPLDPDPRGLWRGGVCARLPELPFPDATFDIVTAFDVVEHCADEPAALAEIWRVLRPGGRLLLSVPAYQWAWSDFDVLNGHHRRYTRTRAVSMVQRVGLRPLRATYAFAAVFPAFAAQRLLAQLLERHRPRATQAADVVPVVEVSAWTERLLLGLCRIDEWTLRRQDLPFGSSVLVAAEKPGGVVRTNSSSAVSESSATT